MSHYDKSSILLGRVDVKPLDILTEVNFLSWCSVIVDEALGQRSEGGRNGIGQCFMKATSADSRQ